MKRRLSAPSFWIRILHKLYFKSVAWSITKCLFKNCPSKVPGTRYHTITDAVQYQFNDMLGVLMVKYFSRSIRFSVIKRFLSCTYVCNFKSIGRNHCREFDYRFFKLNTRKFRWGLETFVKFHKCPEICNRIRPFFDFHPWPGPNESLATSNFKEFSLKIKFFQENLKNVPDCLLIVGFAFIFQQINGMPNIFFPKSSEIRKIQSDLPTESPVTVNALFDATKKFFDF